MCGIAGFFGAERNGRRAAHTEIAARMSGRLRHRGPDDAGTWADAEVGVALAHRRLAVVELSPQGRQPMRSASGRYVLTFNGEIYNFRRLRVDLGDYPFRGQSDTEVMLAAFERWGVTEAVPRFNGMFAFAVWDAADRVLTLARDRLGEKPLYYGKIGDALVFGSELKSLCAHPDFRGQIDLEAVHQYLEFGYIPAPRSIYEGIRKLPPGTLLKVESPNDAAEPEAYWSACEVAIRGYADRRKLSDREAEEELEALVSDSVKLRMTADVPVGAFLSGGIDSSLVASLMQKASPSPVKTFSIGFETPGYDEAAAAREVARHLGTEHREWYVTARDAQALIPALPAVYDEPFADSSQIPTMLVSRRAREFVTVSLSGDGGDELFAGYTRYRFVSVCGRAIGWTGRGARRMLARGLTRASSFGWDRRLSAIQGLLPQRMRLRNPAGKFRRLASMLKAETLEERYRRTIANDFPPCSSVPDGWVSSLGTPVERMMLIDALTYLPDDILVKLDRASMAVGLESRAPLLDHRIFEFACKLPYRFKVRGSTSKWLLRRVLYRHVPGALVDGPKRGFSIPLGDWLRGPLREWAEELLSRRAICNTGLLDPEIMRTRWREHLSCTRDWSPELWAVLMFQSWFDHQRSASTESSEICHVPTVC